MESVSSSLSNLQFWHNLLKWVAPICGLLTVIAGTLLIVLGNKIELEKKLKDDKFKSGILSSGDSLRATLKGQTNQSDSLKNNFIENAKKTEAIEQQNDLITSSLTTTQEYLKQTKQELNEASSKIVPRSISNEQKSIIIDFEKNKPKCGINIAFSGEDPECERYAVILADLLTEVGFNIEALEERINFPAEKLVGFVSNTNLSAAGFLQQAFDKASIEMQWGINKELKDNEILIVIGPK